MQLKTMRWVKCCITVAFVVLSATMNICEGAIRLSDFSHADLAMSKSLKSVARLQNNAIESETPASEGDEWVLWIILAVVVILLLIGIYVNKKYSLLSKLEKLDLKVTDRIVLCVLVAAVCLCFVLYNKEEENAEVGRGVFLSTAELDRMMREADSLMKEYKSLEVGFDSAERDRIMREVDSIQKARKSLEVGSGILPHKECTKDCMIPRVDCTKSIPDYTKHSYAKFDSIKRQMGSVVKAQEIAGGAE